MCFRFEIAGGRLTLSEFKDGGESLAPYLFVVMVGQVEKKLLPCQIIVQKFLLLHVNRFNFIFLQLVQEILFFPFGSFNRKLDERTY